MLMRLLLLIVVVVVVTMVVRRARVTRSSDARPPARETKTMRCAHCAVYFPSSEAVVKDGRNYCSRPHAERARART